MNETEYDIEKEYRVNKVFCTVLVFIVAIGACSIAFSKLTQDLPVSKEEYKEALRMVSESTLNGDAISRETYGHGMAYGKLTKGDFEKIKKAYKEKSE